MASAPFTINSKEDEAGRIWLREICDSSPFVGLEGAAISAFKGNAGECETTVQFFVHGGRKRDTEAVLSKKRRKFSRDEKWKISSTLYSLCLQRSGGSPSACDVTILSSDATTNEPSSGSPSLYDHVLFCCYPYIFLHGGRDGDGAVQNSLHAFHLVTKTWTLLGPERLGGVGSPRFSSHAVTPLGTIKGSNSKFVLIGAEAVPRERRTGSSLSTDDAGKVYAPPIVGSFSAFILNFRDGLWSRVPDAPHGSKAAPPMRTMFTLCAVEKRNCGESDQEEDISCHGSVFLAGGVRGKTCMYDMWQLCLRTGEWKQVDFLRQLPASLPLAAAQYISGYLDPLHGATSGTPFSLHLVLRLEAETSPKESDVLCTYALIPRIGWKRTAQLGADFLKDKIILFSISPFISSATPTAVKSPSYSLPSQIVEKDSSLAQSQCFSSIEVRSVVVYPRPVEGRAGPSYFVYHDLSKTAAVLLSNYSIYTILT